MSAVQLEDCLELELEKAAARLLLSDHMRCSGATAVLLLLPAARSLVTVDHCQSGSMESSETVMESAMELLYHLRLLQLKRQLEVTMEHQLVRWDLLQM